ncbi:MAG: DUF6089 family protein [Bacteroidota bacterium]|nr:DUF6089 family protein [Bacteroidota bacterium]
MKKLFTIILLFASLVVSAQQGEIGALGGLSYYNGDINPLTPKYIFDHPQKVAGLFYRYNLDDRLAIRITYSNAEIAGDDALRQFQPDRQMSFKTSLNELSAQFEVNFFKYSTEGDENRFAPYIFGGLGATNFKVKEAEPNSSNVPLPKGSTLVFPLGIGIKYCLFPNVTAGLEWGIRKTCTSKLDNVYTDPYRLSTDNDWYSFLGFSISWKFNLFNSYRCYN